MLEKSGDRLDFFPATVFNLTVNLRRLLRPRNLNGFYPFLAEDLRNAPGNDEQCSQSYRKIYFLKYIKKCSFFRRRKSRNLPLCLLNFFNRYLKEMILLDLTSALFHLKKAVQHKTIYLERAKPRLKLFYIKPRTFEKSPPTHENSAESCSDKKAL
jgi:hypothetical protein